MRVQTRVRSVGRRPCCSRRKGYTRPAFDARAREPRTERGTPSLHCSRWKCSATRWRHFSARVSNYVELRNKLAQGLPGADGGESGGSAQGRARAGRQDPRRARRCETRRHLHAAHQQRDEGGPGPPGGRQAPWADLVDDNPGEFAKRINASYPEERPFSTVPANILAILPQLPSTWSIASSDPTLAARYESRRDRRLDPLRPGLCGVRRQIEVPQVDARPH